MAATRKPDRRKRDANLMVGFDGGILHRESACSVFVRVQFIPQTEAIRLLIEHLPMRVIKEDLDLNTTHGH